MYHKNRPARLHQSGHHLTTSIRRACVSSVGRVAKVHRVKTVWPKNGKYLTPLKTIFLHLAPGVPFTLAFLLAARLVNRAGGSTYLALLLSIPLLLVCEVGVLIVERNRINWSWRSIIVPRGSRRVSILDILLSVAVIYVIAQVAGALATPSRTAILRAMAPWLRPGPFSTAPLGLPHTWLTLRPRHSDRRELYFRAFSCQGFQSPRRWAHDQRCPRDLSLLHSPEPRLSPLAPTFDSGVTCCRQSSHISSIPFESSLYCGFRSIEQGTLAPTQPLLQCLKP